MASPQLENGFLRLSNELAEALARTPLSGSELRIILTISRECYGRNGGRKVAPLSYGRIAAATGLALRTVQREVGGLLKDHVLVREANRRGNTYGLQKNYELWLTGGVGQLTDDQLTDAQGTEGESVNQPTKLSVNRPTHKKKEEKEKKVRAEKQPADPRFKRIVEHYCQSYEQKHGEKADFGGRDGKTLSEFLQGQPELSVEAICARMDNAFQSTSGYPLDRKFRLYEFLPQHAKYADGPRHRKSSSQSDWKGNGQGETAQTPLLVGRSRPTSEGEAILKRFGVH